MNPSAIDLILRRRSVRSYTEAQISDGQLQTILRCALYAPSGGNCQYSRFIVLQDPAVLEELNRLVRSALAGREIVPGQWLNKGILRARQPGDYQFMYRAPTLISAVAPRDHANSMADCSCALENMQLAADALGLGSCWINQPHWVTDDPAVRALFGRFGLREDEDIFGSVSVGYEAAPRREASPRKPGRVILDAPRDIGL